MLEDASPKAVLTYKAEIKTDIPVIDLADSEVLLSAVKNQGCIDNPEHVNKPEDLIYCIYTSGTTGKPKGVMIEHRNLVNFISFKNASEFKITMSRMCEVIYSSNKIIFDITMEELFLPICNGIKVVLADNEWLQFSEADVKTIKSGKKVGIITTPTKIKNCILSEYKDVLKYIDFYSIGAENLQSDLIHLLRQINPNAVIFNGYGPTEATCGMTYYLCESDTYRIPIGKPIANTQVYIVNKNTLCGIGVPGELCIAGDGLARGYLNRPELTGEKFVKNPYGEGKMYHTGDLARWLPDGNIEYLGRIDDQVKIRGFRIELGEIETRIREINTIKDCAVIARESAGGDKAVYAYVVSDEEISTSMIRDELSKVLPDYMVPSYMMQIESIPITRNGKLDRRALPEIEAKTENEYIAPRTEEEEALCEAFKAMLGAEKVSVTDSFFELGGDSIKAIRVVSDMRTRGYTVTVKDILNRRTPENIALYVKKAEQENYEQGEVTGTVTKTPIMRQFEADNLKKPEHFNQAIIIPVDADTDVIGKALNKLVCHHDILRAVYANGTLEVLSYKNSKKYDLFEYDVKGHENVEEEIHEICTKIQSGINLSDGPLMKAGLFDTDYGKYLMICIHHLAVDGVSWRILLEDFETAVEGYKNKKEAKLPEKTASFIEWSRALEEYRTSEELIEEKAYWNTFEEHRAENRLYIGADELTEQINGNTGFELSEEVTENLLRKSGRAYNTQINDVLLAALGMAVGELTGQPSVSVGIEGHGRETIHKPINIDRTVGWFTSLYPVVLKCSKNTEDAIIDTKDMLREVPNNGMGYGHLYDTDLSSCVDIYFNYLGEMDSENTDRKDTISFSSGESIAPENRMSGYININAYMSDKKFVCNVTYNNCTDVYAEKFTKFYENAVKEVVEWCVNQKETHITESDMYLLTPLQEGMYFHNQLDANDSSYKLQSVFKTNMRVNFSHLRLSLNCLADKYEVLKTSFKEAKSNGVIKQFIDADRSLELTERKYKETFDESHIKAYALEDLLRGFDLGQDSLLRVAVLSFADCDVLFVSSHHIIIDGWCDNFIYGDLVRFYNLCLVGTEEIKLRRLVQDEKKHILSFREYVEWINQIKKSDVEKYWNDYLEDYDSVAELTSIEKVRGIQDEPVVESVVSIDIETTSKLESIAKNCDATISTVSQLAVGILLQKHCATDDVLIGNVVSGRNVPLMGIENSVGMFVNTVPLRITVESKNETMESMLRRLQKTNNESNSYDHAALSDMIIGGRNVSEYIRHLFVFENFPGTDGVDNDTDQGAGLELESLYAREQTNYDIIISAFVIDKKLTFRFAYDPNKYTENNIEIIKSHLENIIRQMSEVPSKEVKDVILCGESERNVILKEFNNTLADYPKDKTVVELFEEQVKKTPDNVAVVFEDESLTYAELNAKANGLALKLRELGVKPDEFVAIVADRSIEIIVGILGIVKAGGAYVPIDPTYPEDRISFIIDDCKPKAVLKFTDLNKCIQDNIPVIDFAKNMEWKDVYENPEHINTARDLIYCIYTSGTTGRPKGSTIEHRSVVRLVKNTNYVELDEKTVILQTGSMSFDASTFEVWGSLLNGGKLVITDIEVMTNSNSLKELINKQKVNTMWMTSTLFNQMMMTDEAVFDGLNHLMIGGEKLSDKHVEILKNRKNSVSYKVGKAAERTANSALNSMGRRIGNQIIKNLFKF